jgi:NAD(P)-dependent dehydrogenase (short-subunit alcohol dehydrogenase family)
MANIVVSGASTGIGRAIVGQLHQRGFRIFAGVRREADAKSLLEAFPHRVFPVPLDVTSEQQIKKAVSIVADRCPDGIKALINNAGIAEPGPLEFVSDRQIRHQLEVNLIGPLKVTQAFLPLIRSYIESTRDFARVINIGSIAGRSASPFLGLYNASKFALAGLSEAQALELKPWNIDVVLVEPGSVDTPMWQKGRLVFEDSFAEMPEEAQRLYGPAVARAQTAAERFARRCIKPEGVARVVLTALTVMNPQPRYLVGADAKFMGALVRLLPYRFRQRLTTSHFAE